MILKSLCRDVVGKRQKWTVDRGRKQEEYIVALTCLEPLSNDVPETQEDTANSQRKETFVYVCFLPALAMSVWHNMQLGARIDLIAMGPRLLRMKWPAWSYHAMYRCQLCTCCNNVTLDNACLLLEWISI